MIALLAAFCVVLLGAFSQSVSGFGFALVSVPLLALATDPRTAVVVVSLSGIWLTLVIAARERAYARWRTAGLITLAALVGMPVGLVVLVLAPDRVLAGVIAVAVVSCTVLVWRNVRLRGGPLVVGAVGLVSGVLSTATGTNGPPLVAAFHSLGYDPRTFRATLAATFAGSGVTGVVAFVIAGQVTAGDVRMAAVALPAIPVGWWLGNLIFKRVDAAQFRRIILVGLVLSSCAALTRTLTG